VNFGAGCSCFFFCNNSRLKPNSANAFLVKGTKQRVAHFDCEKNFPEINQRKFTDAGTAKRWLLETRDFVQ
jgi:hypothetical protein